MKKLLCAFALLFAVVSYGQLTLIGEYSGNVEVIELLKDGLKILTYERISPNEVNVVVYNMDNSLWKQVTLNYKESEGSLRHVSQNVIDGDDGLEFIISTYVHQGDNKCKILDSDGVTSIFQIDGYVTAMSLDNRLSNNSGLYYSESGWVLKLLEFSGDYTQRFYKLNGTGQLSSNSLSPKSYKSYPYPVPSATIVNIDYVTNKGELTKIGVYDASGNQIETFTMNDKFDTLKLDVTNYASGVYVYQIENATGITNGKFIVE